MSSRIDATSVNPAYTYNHIDGVERLDRYEVGGYHPVTLGDTLNHGRYEILDKLGHGGWSTCWLARDTKMYGYVALKIGIPSSLGNETSILRALAASPPTRDNTASGSSISGGQKLVPEVLDEFKVHGPNGTHPCYTMPVAQGSVEDLLFCRLFPLDVLRAVAAQLTLAVAYIHSHGYIHGDIRLRNVLVKQTPEFDKLSVDQLRKDYGDPDTEPVARSDGCPELPANVPRQAVLPMPLFKKKAGEFTLRDARILLSDFGEAFSPATDHRLGRDCHSPLAVRPPEAYFEPEQPLSFASDIWTLGRAIWDLLGMKTIISSDFMSETEVVAQYVDVLAGPMPADWWARWDKRSRFFDEHQNHLNPSPDGRIWTSMDHAFDQGVQKWRRKRGVGEFSSDEAAAILSLIRGMMAYRPQDRPSAEQVLQSDWMVQWALPEYEKATL